MNPFTFLWTLDSKPTDVQLREAWRMPGGPWAVEQVVGNKHSWKYSLSDELFVQLGKEQSGTTIKATA